MSGLRVALALAAAAAGTAVVLTLSVVHDALADGDPASDYLINQQLFLPFKANLSGDDATELTGILDDSKRKGFPLKVAVISSRYDLGSVPSLFGKPEQYASFLGQEDFYFFKSELLVVMPKGYGLYKHSGVDPGDRAAVAKLRAPGTAATGPLIAAADRAVRALAARRGLTLSAASSSSGSSPWRDRAEIIAGVLVLCAIGVVARLVLRR
jgi:hypothetical protein